MTTRELKKRMRELGRRSAGKRGKKGSPEYKAYYKALSAAGHRGKHKRSAGQKAVTAPKSP